MLFKMCFSFDHCFNEKSSDFRWGWTQKFEKKESWAIKRKLNSIKNTEGYSAKISTW